MGTLLQVTVNVEVEGGRVITVTVREGAPVISVMFQVAKTAGLTLTPTSSLFEIVPQLRLREPEIHPFDPQTHLQSFLS